MVSLTSWYKFLGFDSFTASGDKNVFLPPGTGRAPFTWEFYLLLSGRKRTV